jgi:hypothetical protein
MTAIYARTSVHRDDPPPSSEEFGIKPGTERVMCKRSCLDVDGLGSTLDEVFAPDTNIFTANFYSELNKDRILKLDDDYMDDEGGKNEGGEARNLTSVTTATTK